MIQCHHIRPLLYTSVLYPRRPQILGAWCQPAAAEAAADTAEGSRDNQTGRTTTTDEFLGATSPNKALSKVKRDWRSRRLKAVPSPELALARRELQHSKQSLELSWSVLVNLDWWSSRGVCWRKRISWREQRTEKASYECLCWELLQYSDNMCQWQGSILLWRKLNRMTNINAIDNLTLWERRDCVMYSCTICLQCSMAGPVVNLFLSAW